MSARNKRFSFLILALLIAGATMILTCSDKILNSDPANAIEFDMALKFSSESAQALAEVVTTYQVTIIADEDTTVANLEYSNGSITGLIENVSAGPNRLIIVEGLAGDGTVIYRGSATITVIANETVEVEITLFAVAKVVRVSPSFADASFGSSFVSNIRVNNVNGLTAISLALDYNSAVIEVDSVKKGESVPDEASFSYSEEGGLEFEISNETPIVDESGNGNLARVYFRPISTGSCLDSTILDLGLFSLTAPSVSLSDIYVDDGKALVTRGKLKVSEDTLRFGLGVEGLNLDFKKVDITDSCGNNVAYTISTEDDWIDLNTAIAGITPGSIFIDIDTTGLESGKYEGRVRINSPKSVNSPLEIVVKLELDRGARSLSVTPGLMVFEAFENDDLPSSRKIHVEELYQYSIFFNVSEDVPWLEIDKTTGTTPDSVVVSINTTNLAPGTYTDTVFISSEVANNSPRFVRVVYAVSAVAKFLEVDKDTLPFAAFENGALPESQEFFVTETGGYNISYNATENASWLTLSGISGTTPDSVTAQIISTELEPGTYYADITVTSDQANNSPQIVTVKYDLAVGERVIAAEPTMLHFAIEQDGPLPEPQTFAVSEIGGHDIPFCILENIDWISVSIECGTTTDTVTVSVTTTEASPGMYFDSIQISSDQADNSPIWVVVSLGVSIGPRTIEVEPKSIPLQFTLGSDDPPAGQFRVFESGGNRIPFSATENVPWLFLTEISGFTEDTIFVYSQPEIEPGFYVDSIMISSDAADNSPIFVVVTLQVDEAPKYLQTDSSSLYLQYIQFNDVFPSSRFVVSERTGTQISFDVSEDAEWLFLNNIDGVTPDEINVNVSIYMEPGVYVDSIMISSDEAENLPIYVKVIFEVIATPRNIYVNPDTLHFVASQGGNLPEAMRFLISADYFGIGMPFYLSSGISWLDVNVIGTTLDTIVDTVSVQIMSTDLEPNVYFDSIWVSSSEAANSPIFEFIEYIITPFFDTIPPSPVTDLNIDDFTTNSAYLSWTASGDDSITGTAVETDIRYSTDLTDLEYWEGAIQVENEPAPQTAGSEENFEITGLTPGYTYYFGLRIIDDAGNVSGLSNVDSVFIPPLPPTTPVLISPDSGAADVEINLTFAWHSALGAETYYLEYDTDGSFTEPYNQGGLEDTTLAVGPLQYETTYYWRVKASNVGGNSNWSNVWHFTTVSAPPTISGVVRDIDDEPLAGVSILLYESYPLGNVLATTTTDIDGLFSFFDINGGFVLYAVKEGYYPITSEIETPAADIQLYLMPTPAFAPSDQWVDLFCDSSYVLGNLIQVNDVIEAFDPDGVLCGRFVVHTTGAYGFMHVYRDDATSEADEGCVTGDAITLKVNGEIAVPEQNLIYPASHQLIEACFNVTGEIPKWIDITKPVGGETFYQDSTVSVEWSSTGISGQVEISLLIIERAIIVLDTTANDGQEMVTIPTGIANSNDWRIQVADLDEPVSDFSETFTISSFELQIDKVKLELHGIESDCLFDQAQFTITEKNGFNVPFEISDTIYWLSVMPSNGTTPAVVTVKVTANDLTSGSYESMLSIASTDLINPPIPLPVEIDLTPYLCGDFTNDCKLEISDLSKLVDYLYRGGAAPTYPDALNVDLCDNVDIADVDYLAGIALGDLSGICEGSEKCTDVANDLGMRDSLGFVVTHSPGATEVFPRLQLDLYLYNDGNFVNGLASGFSWDNPNMKLDSVRFSPYVEDSLSLHYAFDKGSIDTTNANDRFLFAANKTIFGPVAPSSSNQLLASYYFSLTSWNAGDSIVVDTLTFSQGTTYKTVTTNGSYDPVWRGPIVINQTEF